MAKELLSDQPKALQDLVPSDWIQVVARLAKCPPDTLTPRLFWLPLVSDGESQPSLGGGG